MPVKFKIYAEHGFILASFIGQVTYDELVSSAEDYASNPAYRDEQNIMIDLSVYSGTQEGFVSLMQSIANVFSLLRVGQSERLIVYVAPTPASRSLAEFISKSVAAIPGYVPRIVESHLEGFEILGVSTQGYDCAWTEAKV